MSKLWPTVLLGDVVEHRKEFITIDDLQMYKRPRVQLHAQGIVQRDEILGAQIKTKKQQVIRSGEFLVAEIDAKLGGFGIVPSGLDGAIVSSHYFLFVLDESRLSRDFLGWYIKTRAFRDQVEAQGSTNYASIRPAHVLGYKIPLPPLAEQQRIAARIDVLSGKIAEAQFCRHRAGEQQAKLLNSWVAQLFAHETRRVEIDAVAEVRGGIQKSPKRVPVENPVRYLTVAHVQRNWISIEDPRYFDVTPEELDRWRLEAGDVLIIEGNGSVEQIGRAALFQGEIENCVHQNHVIRIRPDRSQIAPEFLNAFLNSPAGQAAVQQQSRTTSGLRSLSVGRIRKIQVPLVTLNKQMNIVAELDRFRGYLDALKRNHIEISSRVNVLLTAILTRAFAGEL